MRQLPARTLGGVGVVVAETEQHASAGFNVRAMPERIARRVVKQRAETMPPPLDLPPQLFASTSFVTVCHVRPRSQVKCLSGAD